MKYIRTKDGRIVDVSLMQEFETDDDNGERIFDGYGDEDGTYYPVENIIKQADTIEELCDAYVVERCVRGEIFRLVYLTKEKMEAEISLNCPYYSIFGSIWIANEKGEPTLKPVIKMKGILPGFPLNEIDWEIL